MMGRRKHHNFLPFLLVLLILASGCQQDGRDAADLLVTPAQAEALAREAENGEFGPPALEAIAQAVDASEEQAAALAPIHGTWVAAMEQRRAARGECRGEGPGWGRAHAGDPTVAERPAADFLVGAAGVLEPAQMVELIGLLEEHQEATRESRSALQERRREGREGPGRRAGRSGRGGQGKGRFQPLFHELDLSAEQKAQLEELHATTRDALLELMQDVDRGEGPDEEKRAQAQTLRTQMQEKVQAILTEEQRQKLEELRSARRLGNAEEAEERFERRLEHRLDLMEGVLKLSTDQRAQVEALLRSHHDEVAGERRFGNWSRGGPMAGRFAGRPDRSEDREALNAAIAELLNEEQQAVFEALQELAPEPRALRGDVGPRGRGLRGGGG
jgi:Spy/CpxP family protein refolding chaperone